MRKLLLAAIAATSWSCGGGTDLGDVSLSGNWSATVNALGISTLTLAITETSSTLTATGQWIPSGTTTARPVTANGLHFEAGINMVFTFDTGTGSAVFTTQGQLEEAGRFYLVFPATDNPVRVNFIRQ